MSNIRSLGKDVVIVWGGRKSIATGSARKGETVRFDEKTLEALEAKAQLFSFSPEVSAWQTDMRAGPRLFNTRLAGVGEQYGELRNVIPDHGRWISRRDIQEARRVCVIGNEVRKKLFGEDSNPLHERVLIGGREFLIVGWKSAKKQGFDLLRSGQRRRLDSLFYSTCALRPLLVRELHLRLKRYRKHELAVAEFKNIVAKVHKFEPEDPEALSLWDTHKDAMETAKVFDAINALMVAIGAITLMIGGLGVMNIMLVSVVERTREIGIRRAIGANAIDIVKQFFLECLIITVIAGHRRDVRRLGVD